jgi:phosphotransferase system IIA component
MSITFFEDQVYFLNDMRKVKIGEMKKVRNDSTAVICPVIKKKIRGVFMDLVITLWNSAVCFLAGILMGRLGRNKSGQAQEQEGNRTEQTIHAQRREREGTSFLSAEKRILLGCMVSSPASGQLFCAQEDGQQYVRIIPEEGKIYAPAAGKIIKLFPTGNAMLLRMENGIVLKMNAGVETEELEGQYYRPRIVRNEIVNKGKLLLEYDIEKLRAEGYDPAITIGIEEAQERKEIIVNSRERVKAGENLFQIISANG